MSQLWWWCCCRFLFGGAQGPVSFRAVKGKGGQSALELCSAGNGVSFRGLWRGKRGQSALEFGGGGVAVVVCFCFGGAQGPVSFRGCEGGNVLSQLWSLAVVASPSVFVWGGVGGQSASGL